VGHAIQRLVQRLHDARLVQHIQGTAGTLDRLLAAQHIGPARVPPNLHPMLNVAIKAARAAGAIINRAALDVESVRISQKQVNDFVTEVDRASERPSSRPCSGLPGHGILAEESGREHGAKDSEFVWIIDPLDGTTNFIHGFPVYCVSIALASRAGSSRRWSTTRRATTCSRHQGPRRLPQRRRCACPSAPGCRTRLIGTGFPFRKGDNFKRYLKMFERRDAALRRPAPPRRRALDLATWPPVLPTASSRPACNPWDVAAGSLLVTEAGGLIGNFTGEADFLDQRECLAGNPKIYGQLVSIIGKYSKFASAGEKAAARSSAR
jgi:myo-inositol-1(or 4)-monophosphatase